MIDNLISDPMKQIWINLELYFEIYEFSNFWDFFSEFVRIVLNGKLIYLILIHKIIFLFSRINVADDVARA